MSISIMIINNIDFLQACKGGNSSYAFADDQQNDSVNLIPADTFTIPFAADMLIVYAAVEGR